MDATERKNGECCGLHEVCWRESQRAMAGGEAEYYDDEELDTYRGRPPGEYTEAETEEFRYVLYTMRPGEVAGWLRSLRVRGVELPDAVRDEAFMLAGEGGQ